MAKTKTYTGPMTRSRTKRAAAVKKSRPQTRSMTKTIRKQNKKQPPAREYEPDLPSDARYTLAEKLLLGEELAQYSFGSVGSHVVGV